MTESSPAVTIDSLSKCFEIYDRPVDMLLEALFHRPRHRNHWALRDISLTVASGEVVGIVGKNGAGKSTLLKILAGTLEATGGEIDIAGRVSAILELGSGFNPERSGRDNIYMGGLCLGMTRNEIQAKCDDIIAFSELEDFIDQPIKTYSTGMYARLAFSVAIAIEPDILIVDEALSVGDVRFQRKCFNHFEQLRSSGKTILFVTHSIETVDSICDRAVYLKDGVIVADGEPKLVTGRYLRDMLGKSRGDKKSEEGLEPVSEEQRESSPRTHSTSEPATSEAAEFGNVSDSSQTQLKPLRYGNGGVTITHYAVEDLDGTTQTELALGERYRLTATVRCNQQTVTGLNIGITVRTVKGVEVLAVNPISQGVEIPPLRQGDCAVISLEFTNWLAPRDYFVTFGAWSQYSSTHYDRVVDGLHLRVVGDCGVLGSSIVNLQCSYRASITHGETTLTAVK